MGGGLQRCDEKKIPDRGRQFAVAVHQLIRDVFIIQIVLNGRDPLIEIQLLELVLNVSIRDIGIDRQVDDRLEILGTGLSLYLPDRFRKHFAVEIIAYCLHMAGLLRAEQVSRSADL